MTKYFIMLASILSFIFGCSSNTYHKKKGEWYYDDKPMTVIKPRLLKALNKRFAKAGDEVFYRGQKIIDCDGASFEAFNENYAKDKTHVYYCDTYRKGQEYYFYKYNNIAEVKDADPLTFKYLGSEYAKDKKTVYFEGKARKVQDVSTFEYLDYSFSKDQSSGYYLLTPIKGSDGKSFISLDHQFSKDKDHVYFSDSGPDNNDSAYVISSVPITGADATTFRILYDNYAIDTAHAYYNKQVITANTKNFSMLGFEYAKNEVEVFFKGQPVAGADAASFHTHEVPIESGDAQDNHFSYKQGIRTK